MKFLSLVFTSLSVANRYWLNVQQKAFSIFKIFVMKLNFVKKYLMPYLSGPACTIDGDCAAPDFPTSTTQCFCEVALGGINELYFIPCTETFSESNVLDLDWWADLIGDTEDPGPLGRSGLGLGSIGKKADKKDRVSSCRTEQLISITWAIKFQIKCFDKSSARSTCAKMNELILRGNKYLVVARMCDGDNTILPVGQFDTSDFNWTVPDNNEESQIAEVELSWKQLGFPCTVDVAGLSGILPKLQ